MFVDAKIRNGNNDEQTRYSQSRQHVEQFSALKIDQEENYQRQSKDPRIGKGTALFCGSVLNSLTHLLNRLLPNFNYALRYRHPKRPRSQRTRAESFQHLTPALMC